MHNKLTIKKSNLPATDDSTTDDFFPVHQNIKKSSSPSKALRLSSTREKQGSESGEKNNLLPSLDISKENSVFMNDVKKTTIPKSIFPSTFGSQMLNKIVSPVAHGDKMESVSEDVFPKFLPSAPKLESQEAKQLFPNKKSMIPSLLSNQSETSFNMNKPIGIKQLVMNQSYTEPPFAAWKQDFPSLFPAQESNVLQSSRSAVAYNTIKNATSQAEQTYSGKFLKCSTNRFLESEVKC